MGKEKSSNSFLIVMLIVCTILITLIVIGFVVFNNRTEKGNGYPLQCSCLFMDRGAWWATVHEVAKSQT